MITVIHRRHPRTRGVRIGVRPSGEVVVTRSKRVPLFLAEHYVKQRWEWIESTQKKLLQDGSLLHPLRPTAAHSKAARAIVMMLLAEYQYMGAARRVRITNTRTRWGSCSTRGTISINWRIALIPEQLQRYLIVHELAHMTHHNHSPAFWSYVGEMIPTYKEDRAALKAYRF
jgi:predicted metal-dependent hydrolase